MKYKVGTDNKVPIIKMDEIKSLASFQWVSSIEPTHIVAANVETITQNSCLGSLSIRFWPWLFRNILSSVYLTLVHLVSKYGTNNIVAQAVTKLIALLCNNSSNNKTIETLKHIPNQKIKFQKLSLFSRDLIQFMMILSVKTLKGRISRFDIFVKQIIKGLIIIIISSLPIIAFAQDTAGDLTSLIGSVEKEHNIPSGLLKAIAKVESNLNAYAINVSGKSFIAKSSLEASKIVRSYLKKGYTNIDVGLIQINWQLARS